jgi:hypothetical protein
MRSSPRGRCGRRSATLTHACGRVPRVCHSPGQGLVVCARSRWVCAPRAVVEKSGASRVSARVLRADPLLVRQFGCHESADRVQCALPSRRFPRERLGGSRGLSMRASFGPFDPWFDVLKRTQWRLGGEGRIPDLCRVVSGAQLAAVVDTSWEPVWEPCRRRDDNTVPGR